MDKAVLFKSSSEEYKTLLERNNLNPIFIEPLQFKFINLASLEEKLIQSTYNGIILTSPRAIEAVSKCMEKQNLTNNYKVYAVGEASGSKIKQLLNVSPCGLETGNADSLADLIIEQNQPGTRFLFPCGNLANETIPTKLNQSNILVDTITVYETEENENLEKDVKNLLNDSSNLILLFFSPSGVEFVVKYLENFKINYRKLKFFAIGKTTSSKLKQLGIQVHGVASKPTAKSLVDAVTTSIEGLNSKN